MSGTSSGSEAVTSSVHSVTSGGLARPTVSGAILRNPVEGAETAPPVFSVTLPPGTGTSDITGKDWIGFILACVVLGLIALLSLILIICIALSELHYVPADIAALEKILANIGAIEKPTSDDLKRAVDLASSIKELRKAGRDFWTSIAQLLLLNILIPVLTSILGYIFGSSRR